jgi:hypothetical protein
MPEPTVAAPGDAPGAVVRSTTVKDFHGLAAQAAQALAWMWLILSPSDIR